MKKSFEFFHLDFLYNIKSSITVLMKAKLKASMIPVNGIFFRNKMNTNIRMDYNNRNIIKQRNEHVYLLGDVHVCSDGWG